jgi:pimeloyl-ACP methyl ester carboxylesterase
MNPKKLTLNQPRKKADTTRRCLTNTASLAPKPFLTDDITPPGMQLPPGFTQTAGWIRRSPGVTLNSKSNNLILYFHGNGECIWSQGLQKKLNLIHKNGFSILAIDYPGYGKSKGSPEIDNLYTFADSTYNYVKRKYPDYNIILWGQSLGTIPAIYLAKNKEVELLISEGTITILPDLKNSLEAFYSTDQHKVNLQIDSVRNFDNYEKIKGIQNRVIFIHGDNDKIAKFNFAKTLYDGFDSDKKEFIVLSGSGHNYSLTVIKEYLKTIKEIVTNEFKTE